jgi:hypothetical protein
MFLEAINIILSIVAFRDTIAICYEGKKQRGETVECVRAQLETKFAIHQSTMAGAEVTKSIHFANYY